MTTGAPRIAYLCTDPGIAPDGTKGASVHFREMAAALRSHGCELDVVMGREPGRLGDAFARIVGPRLPRSAGGELGTLADTAAAIATLAAGTPHDLVYERLSLFSIAGSVHARAQRIPHFVEINAPLWLEAERYRELGSRRSAKALALDVLEAATRVFAVSRAIAEVLIGEGIPAARIEVLGNGASRALFESPEPAEIPARLRGKPVLVFFGSLKPWHGIEFMLGAFREACARRPLGLWIVGDGPLRDLVTSAAERSGGAIVCTGAVSHDRIPQILAAADVALAPYPASAPDYFSPLKVVEAMAARIPLVASRVRPVLDTVLPSARVHLHAPDDVTGFVDALERALADSGAPRADFPEALGWDRKAERVLGSFRGVRAIEVARG